MTGTTTETTGTTATGAEEISFTIDAEIADELGKLIETHAAVQAALTAEVTAEAVAPRTAQVRMNKETAARLFSALAGGILEAAAITSRATRP